MTATYLHGTAVLAEHTAVAEAHQGFGVSAAHGLGKAAGQILTGAVAGRTVTPTCSAPGTQSAQAACTDTAVFGGGSTNGLTHSPIVIVDATPNFRTEKLPRDRQPV